MSSPDALLPARRAFTSYGALERATVDVLRPDSVEALAGALRDATSRRQSLVFRGAGASFHDQALGDATVLLLDKMPRRFALDGDTLDADAAVTYGDACHLALGQDRVFATTPTCQRITLAGGLVANSVARFSSRVGKAADAVEAFELVSPDGVRRTVRRPDLDTTPENDALFRAVPGAFGYLGSVTRLRTRLLRLPPGVPDVAHRVETVATRVTEFAPMIDALVGDHVRTQPDPVAPTLVPTFPPSRRTDTAGAGDVADEVGTWGLIDQDGLGMVFRSRYVPGDRPLDPFFLHRPDGVLHQVAQFASIFRVWSRVGWTFAWRLLARRSEIFVDSFDGYTFMMDGNWQARSTLRRAGIAAWLVQQSYLLPIRRDATDPGVAPKAFLERARRALHDAGVRADCIDLLVLPADRYLLSAARGMEGVLISIACQGLSRATAATYTRVLRELATDCASLGGRVHLVKHVFVEPDVMRAFYGDALDQFVELKRTLDPAGVLRNPFLDRLLQR